MSQNISNKEGYDRAQELMQEIQRFIDSASKFDDKKTYDLPFLNLPKIKIPAMPGIVMPLEDPRFGTFDIQPKQSCFLAGTEISMWDGTKKPIEDVNPGDWVTSYDSKGKLVPGCVKRTFQNKVRHILDLHGLMVTPGHVTFCAKVPGENNPFAGSHVPIIDILRSDGALMREDGTLVRASTGCVVGTLGDKFVWATVGAKEKSGSFTEKRRGRLRLATRFILDSGSDVSVLQICCAAGLYFHDEGYIAMAPNGPALCFHWEFTPNLPKPEDYVLQRSSLSLSDIYSASEWEQMKPVTPTPGSTSAHFEWSPQEPSGVSELFPHMPQPPPFFRKDRGMSRQQRRALERGQRKQRSPTIAYID
jgi:hypothetical protein